MTESSYDLQVVGVVEETADAHSVSFGVPEGAEAEFDYKPGQFLTLAVPSDQTGVAARCYSLSSSPARRRPADRHGQADRRRLRLQLDLRQPRARASTIRVLPPSGIFTPASLDADLLLFAGGSGITPIMSITRTALAHGSGQIVLFYANRDETSVIFASELSRAGRRAPAPAGRRALAGVGAGAAHPGADEGVHRAVHDVRRVRVRPRAVHEADDRRAARAGVPARAAPPGEVRLAGRQPVRRPGASRREAEHELEEADSDADFDRGLPEPEQHEAAEGAPEGNVRLEVELDGETYAFDDWAPTTKMLEHLESKGVKAPYSCREGECSACAVRLLEGEVKMLHNDVLDDEDLAEGIRLGLPVAAGDRRGPRDLPLSGHPGRPTGPVATCGRESSSPRRRPRRTAGVLGRLHRPVAEPHVAALRRGDAGHHRRPAHDVRRETVAVVPGGGTYAMEAVARQLATGRRCLVVRNGLFSYRWSQILDAGSDRRARRPCCTRAAGVRRAPGSVDAGSGRRGGRGHRARPVPRSSSRPHVETAAGMVLPDDYVRAVAAATHEVGGLFVLDCIASGALWVDMTDLGVDVLLSAPQKGWSGSPCAGYVMLGEAGRDAGHVDDVDQLRGRPPEVADDHRGVRRRARRPTTRRCRPTRSRTTPRSCARPVDTGLDVLRAGPGLARHAGCARCSRSAGSRRSRPPEFAAPSVVVVLHRRPRDPQRREVQGRAACRWPPAYR